MPTVLLEVVIKRLSSKQRAFLRAQAHSLKALIHLGKEGVTEAALGAVEEAFKRRELLKVRVLDGSPVSVREAADALANGLEDVHVVQVIGGVIVLYRPHPSEPELTLPR